MWAVKVAAAVICLCSAAAYSQSIAEMNSAMEGNAQLDSMSVTGGASGSAVNSARDAAGAANNSAGLPAPPTAGFGNSTVGVGLPPAGGLPALPSAGAAPAPLTGYPGLSGPAAFGATAPISAAQPGVATPTPLPTIKVLTGRKVTCAVCGTLLQDPVQMSVLQSDQDKYLDDGIHDNGIADDGYRGNVSVVSDAYVGPECNAIKNRMINVVRRAEDLSPMHFFRYHTMSVDPITAHPRMPKALEQEEQRDEMLRDWNNRFLADYRVNKNDPKSEFYQIYVPSLPLPPQYPLPPGYVAPQKRNQVGPGGAPVVGTPNIYNGDAVIAVPGAV